MAQVLTLGNQGFLFLLHRKDFVTLMCESVPLSELIYFLTSVFYNYLLHFISISFYGTMKVAGDEKRRRRFEEIIIDCKSGSRYEEGS